MAQANVVAALTDKIQTEDERIVLAATAAITFLAALGVSGGTNLVMILTKDPIIKKHKATLSFVSAWIGDGVLLPIINVLMMMAFRRWHVQVGRRNGAVALAGGMGIMSAFQIAQGLQGMTNYTMPKPWRWTWLGYYHMLYMGSQFTYMLFYFIALYHAWQKGQVTAAQKRDLAAIAGMIALFAGLLQYDYS